MRDLLRHMGAILTALLGAAATVGCRSEKPPAPTVALSLPAPGTDGIYRVTADELYKSFKENKKSTEQVLKGKMIIVTGRVMPSYSDVEVDKKQATSGGPTNPSLFLDVNYSTNPYDILAASNSVTCSFPDTARPQLRALLKKVEQGNRVAVRGSLNGFSLGTVWLENCSLEGIVTDTGTIAPVTITPKGSKTKDYQKSP